MDQGQPGFPATVFPEFLDRMKGPHQVEIKTSTRLWSIKFYNATNIAKSVPTRDAASAISSPTKRDAAQ